MNAIYFVLLAYYIGVTLSAGCGSSQSKLGFHTRSVGNGQTSGSEIWAKIYSGGSWTDWRKLNHLDCDDFEQGHDDYFNDFDDKTGSFDAIALEICGNDGWAIDTIHTKTQQLANFCPVNGVSSTCYGSGGQGGGCGEYVWLDGDGLCPTMTIKLDTSKTYSDPGSAPCGQGETNCGNPMSKLGIHTANVGSADADTVIYARIFANGKWQRDWRFLDNGGCDDFVKDYTDYFSDFNSITSRWDAIALHNCGNDGLAIEGIKGFNTYVSGFCGSNCAYSSGGSSCASFVWLDGNGVCANGLTVKLSSVTITDPGEPSCPNNGEYGAHQPFENINNVNNDRKFNLLLFAEQQQIANTEWLLNEMNFVLLGVAFLFIATCALAVIVARTKNRANNYDKIDKLDE